MLILHPFLVLYQCYWESRTYFLQLEQGNCLLTCGFPSLAVFYLCVVFSTLVEFLPSCSLAVSVEQKKVVVASNISTTPLYVNIVNRAFPATGDQSIVYLVLDIPISVLKDGTSNHKIIQAQISLPLSILVHLASSTFP